MTTQRIDGNLLYVTVINCNKLKDTEWFSRQDPYVCIEYGGNRSQTRTHTDGGKNPKFEERFVYTLVEGLRELNVSVWNSNNILQDGLIGSGKIPLSMALSKGFDDSNWPLKTRSGRHAGEVRLIMQYKVVDKMANNHVPVVQPQPSPHFAPPTPPPQVYHAQLPAGFQYPPSVRFSQPPPPPTVYYPQPASGYSYPPPSPYHPSYPPNSGGYPPYTYAPQPVPYAEPFPPNVAYPQVYGSYQPTCKSSYNFHSRNLQTENSVTCNGNYNINKKIPG